MPPKVSVVIATYNAGEYICQAIDSVLVQTYTDFEIIVVDDGSTDDTQDRVQAYDDRVVYVYQDNQERSAARNHGIRLSQGEYIAFLDADDYWNPDKLEKQIELLDVNPELGMVYCWMQSFSANESLPTIAGQAFVAIQDKLDTFQRLVLGTKSIPLCGIVRRQCLQDVGYFDEDIVVIEDWDLWLRVTLKYPIDFVPDVLAFYRRSGKFLPAGWARHDVQRTRVEAVNKAFAMARAEGIELPSGLEQQALARACWRGSLIDYAVNDIASAQQRCLRAIEYDPAFFFHTTDDWIESLIGFAISLYDTETPQQEAERFVESVFDHLPHRVRGLGKFRRRAIGKLKAGYGFRALKHGNTTQSRQLMHRAVLYYPPLLRNLGVVSICLRGAWFTRLHRST